MHISQMQFAFVAEQDRLLFRVNGANGEEVSAWFTRRLVKLLWPNLVRVLSHRIEQDNPAVNPQARPIMLEMKREAHLQKADFSTPYREHPKSFPLGKEPFLVERVDLVNLTNRETRVSLKPHEGTGVDIQMPDNMLHAFCETLQQAAQKASWDLRLSFQQEASATPAQKPSLTIN